MHSMIYKLTSFLGAGIQNGCNFAKLHLIIGVVCIVILAIPLWLDIGYSDIDNSSITLSIESTIFVTSVYTLLVTTVPSMLDGFLDFIEIIRKPSIKFSPQFIGRSFITIACFLCAVQLLKLKYTPSIFGFTENPVTSLLFTLFAVRVTLFTSILYICSSILPTVFTFKKTMSYNLLGCFVSISRFYTLDRKDDIYKVFGLIALLFFLYSFILKLYWLLILLRRFHHMTIDDYTCILYICLFLWGLTFFYIPIIQNFILNQSFSGMAITECSEYSLTVMMSTLCVFMVVLTIIPGRIVRYQERVLMKEIIQTKTNYVRFISHELRTPLNTVFLGINYTINQLQDEDNHGNRNCEQCTCNQDTVKDSLYTKAITTNKRHVDTLEEISEACNAALTILNELLLYDKLENGILELNKKDVNIMKMLEDASKMFSVQLRDKHIDLSLSSNINMNEYKNIEDNNTTDTSQHHPPILSDTSTTNMRVYCTNESLSGISCSGSSSGDNSNNNRISHSSSFHNESSSSSSSSMSCMFPITADDTVHIDSTKIIQVIRNIISNAIKFTSSGGHIIVNTYFQPTNCAVMNTAEVKHRKGSYVQSLYHALTNYSFTKPIRCVKSHVGDIEDSPCCDTNSPFNYSYNNMPPTTRTMEIHGHLVIEIKDDGIGISDTDQLKLFHNIIQFNPDILQNGGGSGLGMWISKGIMDLHQGMINVHSSGVGLGSTFTLRLPMSRFVPHTSLSSYGKTTCILSPSSKNCTQSVYSSTNTPTHVPKANSNNRNLHLSPDETKHSDIPIRVPLNIISIEDLEIGHLYSIQNDHVSSIRIASNNDASDTKEIVGQYNHWSLQNMSINDTMTDTTHVHCIQTNNTRLGLSNEYPDTTCMSLDSPRVLCDMPDSTTATTQTNYTIKVSDVHVDEFKTPTSNVLVSSNYGNTDNRKHILVVDDSSMNRKMLIRLLTSCGYTCDEAYDGCEAVKKVTVNANIRKTANQHDVTLLKTDTDSDESSVIVPMTGSSDTCKSIQTSDTNTTTTILPLSYDAILMDFMMPNMDGPTATAEIRKLGYTGPILGVTGNALQVDIDYFIRQGANQVLIKPIDSKVMQATLEGMYC